MYTGPAGRAHTSQALRRAVLGRLLPTSPRRIVLLHGRIHRLRSWGARRPFLARAHPLHHSTQFSPSYTTQIYQLRQGHACVHGPLLRHACRPNSRRARDLKCCIGVLLSPPRHARPYAPSTRRTLEYRGTCSCGTRLRAAVKAGAHQGCRRAPCRLEPPLTTFCVNF
jgi:hypothetical protein